jgi:hypothetical protein
MSSASHEGSSVNSFSADADPRCAGDRDRLRGASSGRRPFPAPRARAKGKRANGPRLDLGVLRCTQMQLSLRRFHRGGSAGGYAVSPDLNGERQEGFGPLDMTVRDGVRSSTANAGDETPQPRGGHPWVHAPSPAARRRRDRRLRRLESSPRGGSRAARCDSPSPWRLPPPSARNRADARAHRPCH